MQLALSVRDICKHYGSHKALNNVSLNLVKGRALGLAGLNGAGKTSLIKCILNFAHPHSGSINIFDTPATNNFSRKNLAYVPERFTGPNYLTGLEYLKLQASFNEFSLSENEIAVIATELDFDTSALKRMLRGYSKGMTQKLGLMSAFLSKRNLLILDEPMSGLDPLARKSVRQLLKAHHARGGTLLLTSHSISDIEMLCDDLAILHQGKLIYSGECKSIKKISEGTAEDIFLRMIGH